MIFVGNMMAAGKAEIESGRSITRVLVGTGYGSRVWNVVDSSESILQLHVVSLLSSFFLSSLSFFLSLFYSCVCAPRVKDDARILTFQGNRFRARISNSRGDHLRSRGAISPSFGTFDNTVGREVPRSVRRSVPRKLDV